MDQSSSTTPVRLSTSDQLNQYRESNLTPFRTEGYDSPVLEKISQFNSMSGQSRQAERKTNDALRRAVLGREEAEGEMRRLRDQVAQLEDAVVQGKDRERKVGQRLETVMDSYGRVKETHAHTQALWEKEIRRARKENFKSQSTIVKLQEELKTARTAAKINEECLQREKERNQAREQEAFTARYQIVGVQEQLEKALERIKGVEQERDAYKTAAKNEEVARIAAEGRLPLPFTDEADEFSSPKKVQKKRKRTVSAAYVGRASLSTMEIGSSAASEMEIEELTLQVAWEKHRADRALEMIEFLQAECSMNSCPGSKEVRRAIENTPQRIIEPVESTTPVEDIDAFIQDDVQDVNNMQEELAEEQPGARPVADNVESIIAQTDSIMNLESPSRLETQNIKRRSTELGVEQLDTMEHEKPEAVLQEQLEELAVDLPEAEPERQMAEESQNLIEFEVEESPTKPPITEDMQEEDSMPIKADESEALHCGSEPKVEECEGDATAPCAHAVPELEPESMTEHTGDDLRESDTEERRESLPESGLLPEPELIIIQSKKERRSTIFCPKEGIFRTVSEQEAEAAALEESVGGEIMADEDGDNDDILLPDIVEEKNCRMFARTPSVEPPSCAIMARDRTSLQSLLSAPHSQQEAPLPHSFNIPIMEDVEPMQQATMATQETLGEAIAVDEQEYQRPESPVSTMYSSTARFKVTTTTIPVRDETSQYNGSFHEKLRTPSSSSSASFDLTDPALTPTMTREQALAKIRERRGRARSIAQATAVAPKKLAPTTAKRDISNSSTKTALSKTTPKTISKATTTRTRPVAKPATSRDTSRATSRDMSRDASRATSRSRPGVTSRAR